MISFLIISSVSGIWLLSSGLFPRRLWLFNSSWWTLTVIRFAKVHYAGIPVERQIHGVTEAHDRVIAAFKQGEIRRDVCGIEIARVKASHRGAWEETRISATCLASLSSRETIGRSTHPRIWRSELRSTRSLRNLGYLSTNLTCYLGLRNWSHRRLRLWDRLCNGSWFCTRISWEWRHCGMTLRNMCAKRWLS